MVFHLGEEEDLRSQAKCGAIFFLLIQLLKDFFWGKDRLKKLELFLLWGEKKPHGAKQLLCTSTVEHANSTGTDINAESVLAWKVAWSTQLMLMGCQAVWELASVL